ncbi:hypothetical protein [Dissulfurispira sp.]|uniref:hypothetical protein n=1 Tax=Dissulfurispira sp. TaxID=2817609 RepID=UPI002FDA4B62
MKALKFGLVLTAAALIVIGFSGTSFAFHSGGVAECEGCHTMHNSFEGNAAGNTAQYSAGVYLLKGSDRAPHALTAISIKATQAEQLPHQHC